MGTGVGGKQNKQKSGELNFCPAIGSREQWFEKSNEGPGSLQRPVPAGAPREGAGRDREGGV